MEDLPENHGKKIKFGRLSIALFKHGGKIYAYQNACPHQNADLADGYIRDMKLYCRLHHWAFNLENGAYVFNPKMRLRKYNVFIENGIVYLDLTIEKQ